MTDRLMVGLAIAKETGKMMGRLFTMPLANMRAEMKVEDGMTQRTVIDITVGDAIRSKIHAAFPHDHIVEEESGYVAGQNGWCWFVDPFDGTSNAEPKFRQSVLGIAASFNGEAMIGIVADPFEATITFAEKGNGAYTRGFGDHSIQTPVRVITGRHRAMRFAEVDALWNRETATPKSVFLLHLSDTVQNIRCFGSNLLAWSHIAQGRIEIAMMDAVGGHWDTAPGLVIVPEAGGKITDVHGNVPKPGEYHAVIATNGELHAEALAAFQVYQGYKGFRERR